MGPVVAVGMGGIYAEPLSGDLQPGREIAIASASSALAAGLARSGGLGQHLARAAGVRLATSPLRGRPARTPLTSVADVVRRLLALAPLVPGELLELEVNPLAVAPDGRLIALDVLANLGGNPVAVRPPRPLRKLGRLVQPRSIAIVGVSSGDNPGHAILRNVLADGFNPERVTVIKPGAAQLDGVRCVPDLASLPGHVDLLVVALPAGATPAFVTEAIERDLAEAMIVIPGGLEEKHGGEPLSNRMREALAASRATPSGGPVVIGGNCLGVRSRPGKYDTLFIPRHKLPAGDRPAPIALITGSGAFAITRLSRLAPLDPRYVVTIGNQMDVTAGDLLAYLGEADKTVRVFGVYVEGFARLDGLRFLEAAAKITATGRHVVLYRAGRTTAGASASAGHTAAIAGDAVVGRELARAAGVTMAETPAAFDDLVRVFALLDGRPAAGRRLAAASNAGSECVTIADHAGSLELAPFAGPTAAALAGILGAAGIDTVVDVRNPLDITPIADAAVTVAVARTLLDAPETDAMILGLVPMTDRLDTLPTSAGWAEDLARANAVVAELGRLWRATTKPWVCVVDAGALYAPFADALLAEGIPVVATADAATRVLAAWCCGPAAKPGRRQPV
jgi:acyl-CoA synthetase (NDP forming)